MELETAEKMEKVIGSFEAHFDDMDDINRVWDKKALDDLLSAALDPEDGIFADLAECARDFRKAAVEAREQLGIHGGPGGTDPGAAFIDDGLYHYVKWYHMLFTTKLQVRCSFLLLFLLFAFLLVCAHLFFCSSHQLQPWHASSTGAARSAAADEQEISGASFFGGGSGLRRRGSYCRAHALDHCDVLALINIMVEHREVIKSALEGLDDLKERLACERWEMDTHSAFCFVALAPRAAHWRIVLFIGCGG